nr:alpha/beta hydrolase [Aneurinibacillus sp. XH2]
MSLDKDGDSRFFWITHSQSQKGRITVVWILTGIGLLAAAALMGYSRQRVRRAESEFPPTGEFVTVEGIRLHYNSKGRGRPIVCLHGGMLSSADYSGVMELASSQYRVLVFDRPGYGYSERPGKGIMTPQNQARLLHEALKKLGATEPILVGHSWSGLLVLSYALQYSDELAGIVLLAPGAYGGKAYPAGIADRILNALVLSPFVGKLLLHTLLVPLGGLAVKSVTDATFAPDPVPHDYRRLAQAVWPRPAQIRANREDIEGFIRNADAVSSRYGELRLPVVIAVGDSDPFRPELQAYRLHREIPHSKLLKIEHTGHMIPQARPEAVLQALNLLEEEIAAREGQTGPRTANG